MFKVELVEQVALERKVELEELVVLVLVALVV